MSIIPPVAETCSMCFSAACFAKSRRVSPASADNILAELSTIRIALPDINPGLRNAGRATLSVTSNKNSTCSSGSNRLRSRWNGTFALRSSSVESQSIMLGDAVGVAAQFQKMECHHNRNDSEQIKRGRVQELHFRLSAVLSVKFSRQNFLLSVFFFFLETLHDLFGILFADFAVVLQTLT